MYRDEVLIINYHFDLTALPAVRPALCVCANHLSNVLTYKE